MALRTSKQGGKPPETHIDEERQCEMLKEEVVRGTAGERSRLLCGRIRRRTRDPRHLDRASSRRIRILAALAPANRRISGGFTVEANLGRLLPSAHSGQRTPTLDRWPFHIRLRVLSGREVCRILSAHGFVEQRRHRSHIAMQRLDADGTTTLPVPDHRVSPTSRPASATGQEGQASWWWRVASIIR